MVGAPPIFSGTSCLPESSFICLRISLSTRAHSAHPGCKYWIMNIPRVQPSTNKQEEPVHKTPQFPHTLFGTTLRLSFQTGFWSCSAGLALPLPTLLTCLIGCLPFLCSLSHSSVFPGTISQMNYSHLNVVLGPTSRKTKLRQRILQNYYRIIRRVRNHTGKEFGM